MSGFFPRGLIVALIGLCWTVNAAALTVIAHRGASGVAPEHTALAYRLAIERGADFIETDLVPSRDGVLFARHDVLLASVALDEDGEIKRVAGEPELVYSTTDVAAREEFADRLKRKQIDGRMFAGWFVDDFTAAELKTLRARERMPELRPESAEHDDAYSLLTFSEVLAIAREGEVGVYPELKSSSYFSVARGQNPAVDMVAVLRGELERWLRPGDRVFVQSFEVLPLLRLARHTWPAGDVRLVQLLGPLDREFGPADLSSLDAARASGRYGSLLDELAPGSGERVTYGDLARHLDVIARAYADGVGPNLRDLAGHTDFVARAHDAKLLVHPYTLRREIPFLGPFAKAEFPFAAMVWALRRMGVDGVFTDHPGLLRSVLVDAADAAEKHPQH